MRNGSCLYDFLWTLWALRRALAVGFRCRLSAVWSLSSAARSEVFGCVDAEQGQAAGQHRPGGFGKRQPGPVGGRGFLVAARQHRVLEGEQGVGDDDQVPGETIGSAVRGRSGEGGGVCGEGGDEGVVTSGVVREVGRAGGRFGATRALGSLGVSAGSGSPEAEGVSKAPGVLVKPRAAPLRVSARARAWA